VNPLSCFEPFTFCDSIVSFCFLVFRFFVAIRIFITVDIGISIDSVVGVGIDTSIDRLGSFVFLFILNIVDATSVDLVIVASVENVGNLESILKF
jgi:hypothetical protein